MTEIASCFYEGTLWHLRHQPVRNDFRYQVMMLYFDLGEEQRLFGKDGVLESLGLWSARWPALARYRRADYFGDPADSLEQSIRQLIEARLGFQPRGPIRLLTNVRIGGWRMNPVSFYYCYDQQGTSLEALVAEVRNTPWNETHCYVIDLRSSAKSQPDFRFETAKEFHVSPFLPRDLAYDWRVQTPGGELALGISVKQAGSLFLDASLALRRKPIDTASKLEYLCKYPWQTALIWLRIYWQAFRLWRKQVPYFPHP
jgi:DUF1365 family protein